MHAVFTILLKVQTDQVSERAVEVNAEEVKCRHKHTWNIARITFSWTLNTCVKILLSGVCVPISREGNTNQSSIRLPVKRKAYKRKRQFFRSLNKPMSIIFTKLNPTASSFAVFAYGFCIHISLRSELTDTVFTMRSFPEYIPEHCNDACQLQTCLTVTAMVWACFSALDSGTAWSEKEL